MMQRPTFTGLRVRTPADAHVIFHAVSLGLLPIVSRRLDNEERRSISSGCVFVWEERGPNAEATGLGIERWTDSIRWGPSRVRDEFLYYHEKEPSPVEGGTQSDLDMIASRSPAVPVNGLHRDNLIKQTYSVFVETPRGRRKWHLIAYFTQETLDFLHTIDDYPQLASLNVPPGKYKTARSANRNRSHQVGLDLMVSQIGYPTHSCPAYGSENSIAINISPQRHWSSLLNTASVLAPLTYLQNIPPPRRHPLDEKALMSFTPGLSWVVM